MSVNRVYMPAKVLSVGSPSSSASSRTPLSLRPSAVSTSTSLPTLLRYCRGSRSICIVFSAGCSFAPCGNPGSARCIFTSCENSVPSTA